jgi:hypothetical protein
MPPKELVLNEFAVIFDENLLDVIGIVDQEGRPPGEPQGNDIAVVPRALSKESRNVSSYVEQMAEQREPAWTRWFVGMG